MIDPVWGVSDEFKTALDSEIRAAVVDWFTSPDGDGMTVYLKKNETDDIDDNGIFTNPLTVVLQMDLPDPSPCREVDLADLIDFELEGVIGVRDNCFDKSDIPYLESLAAQLESLAHKTRRAVNAAKDGIVFQLGSEPA